MIIKYSYTIGKSNGQKQWMLHFMPDVRSCQIIVKSLWIIFYLYLLLSSTFILPFYTLFIKLISWKRLHTWVEFFLLIISSRSSWVHKYLWTNHSSQYFWFLRLVLLNINYNKEMEILAFVIISCWRKLHSAKVHLSIDHLHFAITSNSNI